MKLWLFLIYTYRQDQLVEQRFGEDVTAKALFMVLGLVLASALSSVQGKGLSEYSYLRDIWEYPRQYLTL